MNESEVDGTAEASTVHEQKIDAVETQVFIEHENLAGKTEEAKGLVVAVDADVVENDPVITTRIDAFAECLKRGVVAEKAERGAELKAYAFLEQVYAYTLKYLNDATSLELFCDNYHQPCTKATRNNKFLPAVSAAQPGASAQACSQKARALLFAEASGVE